MVDIKLTPSIEPASSRIAMGAPRAAQAPNSIVSLKEADAVFQDMKDRALYKIELHFGKDRSSLSHKLCTGAILIWESGKRFHGGGDDKMYWCGYTDCGQPFASSNFGPFSVVCPTCHKENFLDPYTKADHVKEVRRKGLDSRSIERLPCIVGERFFKMTPPTIADLLVKTFRELDHHADVYLKFHPLDFRYTKNAETTRDMDRLVGARMAREPVIYPLKRIIADTTAGADLRACFLAMITA